MHSSLSYLLVNDEPRDLEPFPEPFDPFLFVLGEVWLSASANTEVVAFWPASCLPRSS
jgi:hypothetical protein